MSQMLSWHVTDITLRQTAAFDKYIIYLF